MGSIPHISTLKPALNKNSKDWPDRQVLWRVNGEVTEKHELKARTLLIWFFLGFLIYFLSIGPVWKLEQSGKIPEGFLVIYKPLFALCSICPPVDYLYVSYVCLWLHQSPIVE